MYNRSNQKKKTRSSNDESFNEESDKFWLTKLKG